MAAEKLALGVSGLGLENNQSCKHQEFENGEGGGDGEREVEGGRG